MGTAKTRHASEAVAAPNGPAAPALGIDRLTAEMNALRRRAKRQMTAIDNTLAELDQLRQEIERHRRSLDKYA